MKKVRLLLLIVFIIPCFERSLAQESGNVNYILETNWIAKQTSLATLDFNEGKSIFHYQFDSSTENTRKDTVDEEGNRIIVSLSAKESDRTGNAIYTDFRVKEMHARQLWGKEYYSFPDTIPTIDWEIKPARKTIGKLNVQLATGYFRGRTYDVWFCTDIPLPYGPWKLSGLPGLILEAKSQDGEIAFLFDSLTIPSKNEMQIAKPLAGKAALSFQDFRTQQNREAEKRNNFRASVHTAIMSEDPNVKIKVSRRIVTHFETTLE